MIFLKLSLLIAIATNCWANELPLRLYPYESETREVKLLNGVWNFRIIPMGEDQEMGFTQKWYTQPLQNVRDYCIFTKTTYNTNYISDCNKKIVYIILFECF